jgi:hypothetical protein
MLVVTETGGRFKRERGTFAFVTLTQPFPAGGRGFFV